MRKLKFPLFAAVAITAFFFTSCDEGDGPESPYELRVIGFEDESLPAAGYVVEDDYAYTEQRMTFTQYFTDWGGTTSWSGFAVSNNTDKTTAGYANQFSVYGSGGAGGSAQFGVVYFSLWDGPAECAFDDGIEREIESVWVANSTYAYLSVRDGDGFGKAFSTADDDWFKLTITGYDAAGEKTGSADVFLADYRAAKPSIMSEWTKMNLTSLGAVNKLDFTFTSTDNDPENGIKTPTYVCLDNIAYREYKTEQP